MWSLLDSFGGTGWRFGNPGYIRILISVGPGVSKPCARTQGFTRSLQKLPSYSEISPGPSKNESERDWAFNACELTKLQIFHTFQNQLQLTPRPQVLQLRAAEGANRTFHNGVHSPGPSEKRPKGQWTTRWMTVEKFQKCWLFFRTWNDVITSF